MNRLTHARTLVLVVALLLPATASAWAAETRAFLDDITETTKIYGDLIALMITEFEFRAEASEGDPGTREAPTQAIQELKSWAAVGAIRASSALRYQSDPALREAARDWMKASIDIDKRIGAHIDEWADILRQAPSRDKAMQGRTLAAKLAGRKLRYDLGVAHFSAMAKALPKDNTLTLSHEITANRFRAISVIYQVMGNSSSRGGMAPEPKDMDRSARHSMHRDNRWRPLKLASARLEKTTLLVPTPTPSGRG